MNTETITAPTPERTAAETLARKVGRPKAEIKYPRGIFTVDSLYELNRGPRGRGKRAKICKLTVRKHIEEQVAAGFLTEVEALKTGKPGQPAKQFICTAVKVGLEAARAARKATPAPVAPPVEAPLSEVPVSLTETPAPAVEAVPATV